VNIISEEYTYGLHRLETIGALSNIVVVLASLFFTLYLSINSFLYGNITHIDSLLLSLFSLLSSIILLPNMFIERRKDLNFKSAFYHVIADLWQYIFGFAIGLIIQFFELRILDPIGSIVLSAILIYYLIPLFKESYKIIMEGSPVNLKEVKTELKRIANVHHIHIWSICPDIIAATLHVVADPSLTLRDLEKIRNEIENILISKFGITHITIQFETKEVDQATNL
jgi:cobalt-zinc-cadmium efflux system protein